MILGAKKKKVKFTKNVFLDNDTPFAIQEAYKTLRTNIMFSLPGEACKKLVITSSSQGEGKSMTAINLGIAMANNGSKVMLVDCDLRLPTIASKIKIDSKPCLTNLLYGMSTADKVIHHLPSGLDIIPAGDIPPNPSETLGSAQMQKLMNVLSDYYDYIILDTPPICTVTDAATMSVS